MCEDGDVQRQERKQGQQKTWDLRNEKMGRVCRDRDSWLPASLPFRSKRFVSIPVAPSFLPVLPSHRVSPIPPPS